MSHTKSTSNQGVFDTVAPSQSANRDIDVPSLLNRAAVSLARSRKLVESWLPLSDAERRDVNRQEKAQITNGSTGVDGRTVGTKAQVESEMVGLGGRSERAGLGANPLPDPFAIGSTSNGAGSSELEKLRRQMLGRKKAAAANQRSVPGNGHLPGKAMAGKPSFGVRNTGTGGEGMKEAANVDAEDDDDEDEGRSMMVKGRAKKRKHEVTDAGERDNVKSSNHIRVQSPDNSNATTSKGLASGENLNVQADMVVNPIGLDASADDVENVGEEQLTTEQVLAQTPTQSTSKRPATYLDEVLATRKKRKKKKKEKSGIDAVAAEIPT